MQYYTMKDYIKLMVYINKVQDISKNRISILREESEEYSLDIKDKKETKKEQKPKIHHKHDKMFRKILNNEKEVAKLINQELAPEKEIKAEDLEKYETKFVSSRYEDKQADIVYKLKNKEVFFLIEHQTKVDKEMPNRIAEYSLQIMNSRKAKNKKVNPVVSPIVIYAGMTKWTVRTSLEEGQEEFKHSKGSSSIIRYNLVDIRNIEEAIAKGTAIARISVIERLKTPEEIIQAVEKFAKTLKNKEEKEELLENIFYIWEDRLNEEEKNMIRKIIFKEKMMKGEDNMSHAQEIIRKHEERLEKVARQESLIDVAKKMLKQKFDIDVITQITGLKREQFIK